MNEARKKLFARFRAKLLLVLAEVSRTAPTGMISGRLLIDQANGIMPTGQKIGETDALAMARDLVAGGYASESPLGERRRGQAFSIDFVQFGVTAKGMQLYTQDIPADPLVDDDRLLEE